MKKRTIALLLLIALLGTLSACRGRDITVSDTTTQLTETEAAPTVTEAPETTAPIPTETELSPETETVYEPELQHEISVVDAFSGSADIEGDTYFYVIPAISVDGEELTQVNAQIWTELYESAYVPYVKEPVKELGTCDIAGMYYDYAEHNGILSVMCYYRSYMTEWEVYLPYNILIGEKRLATRAEVLAAFGMTEEEYLDQAADVMGCKLWDDMQNYLISLSDQPAMAEEAYSMILMTISEENANAAIPYISETRELNICGTVYTPAGTGHYTALIPMSYPVSADYYDFIKNIT